MTAAAATIEILACACGPAPRTAVTSPHSPHDVPRFTARGHARLLAPDGGEIDGELRLRVDPPARAWVEVRADALVGLVRQRLVATLPGDGFLVTYDERADAIERVPFASSWLAEQTCARTPAEFIALATGRLTPELRARALGGTTGRDWGRLDLAGAIILRWLPDPGPFERLECWRGPAEVLTVEYRRYDGASGVPSRLRAVAPGARFRCEIELDRVEPRDSFTARDFELDGNPEGR